MRSELQREGRYEGEGEESRQPVDRAHETRKGEDERGPVIDQRRLTICPLRFLRFSLCLCSVLLLFLPLLIVESFQRVLSLCSTSLCAVSTTQKRPSFPLLSTFIFHTFLNLHRPLPSHFPPSTLKNRRSLTLPTRRCLPSTSSAQPCSPSPSKMLRSASLRRAASSCF